MSQHQQVEESRGSDEQHSAGNACGGSQNRSENDDNPLGPVAQHHPAGDTRRSEGGLWSDSINPILREVGATVSKMTGAAKRKATNRLHELLGALVEHHSISARTATIFLCIGDGRLRAVATANVDRTTWEILETDRGIVPWVAREGETRHARDVDHNEDYHLDDDDTRSELAIPLKLANGVVIGVVNLESDQLEHFDQTSEDTVERFAGEIIVELLVLWELATGGSTRLPWHHMTHGWSVHQLVTEVCHCITRSLNQDRVKAAVPYVDLENKEAYFYATSGAGYAMLTKPLPKLEASELFQALQFPVGQVVPYNPADDLSRANVTVNVEEGWLVRIHSTEEALESVQGMAALIVFVTKNKVDCELERISRQINVQDALPEIASLIHDWFEAFARLRPLMAHALLESKIHPIEERRGKFESFLRTALDTVSARAGTVFAVPTGSQRLVCIETTGVINSSGDENPDDDLGYDLLVDVSNLTPQAAFQKGKPLRINHVCRRGRGPHAKLIKSRSAKIREVLPGRDKNKRRFLAVALMENDEVVGVLRIVRTIEDRPFSKCDEQVMEMLAQLGAHIVQAWRDESAQRSGRKRNSRGRQKRPAPYGVKVGRSLRCEV